MGSLPTGNKLKAGMVIEHLILAKNNLGKIKENVKVSENFEALLHDLELEKKFDLYKFNKNFANELIKTNIDFELEQFGTEDFRGVLDIAGRIIVFNFFAENNLQTTLGLVPRAVLLVYSIIKENLHDVHFTVPLGGDFGSLSTLMPDLKDVSTAEGAPISTSAEWRVVANAIAYLRSGNPDLRAYKPPEKDFGTRKERDRIVQENGSEECFLVSWGWKKPMRSHTDSWEVEGHFFWCPAGVGRTKRVLTWRKPHIKSREKSDFTL